MCGIIGYIGKRPITTVLLDGLRRLEYRGYDSAGISWIEGNKIRRLRASGKITNLMELVSREVNPSNFIGSFNIGIGHTRWATHGEPNEVNAHPHTDSKGEIVIVHNGIIENYISLKRELEAKGHVFESETDSEVIAHLIDNYYINDLLKAVFQAIKRLIGSYAIVIMSSREPNKLIAVRRHSPLVIGISEGEAFVASDVPAFLPYTRQVKFLPDDTLAVIQPDLIKTYSVSTEDEIEIPVSHIDWDISMAEKAGFRHFMLKEIHEEPQAIENSIAGRIELENGKIMLPEIQFTKEELNSINRIIFIACGTSWHAGLVASYWFEEWLGLPCRVELASEFRYRSVPMDNNSLIITISQSGETADTLAALRKAKEKTNKILSICNVLGSTMSRESRFVVYTHAGPEIGVASTKAFIAQLTVLYLIGLYLSQEMGKSSKDWIKKKIKSLIEVPKLLNFWIPIWRDAIKDIAEELSQFKSALYLGRHVNYPIALEGALKLKEISYIHAEGYAAGEMKHGPIALIDKEMPVVALVAKDHVMEKMISNIQEVKSRKGRLIIISESEEPFRGILHFIKIPEVEDRSVTPFIFTVPLQLLAYETAVIKGCDVDQPRNLAKSVTVE